MTAPLRHNVHFVAQAERIWPELHTDPDAQIAPERLADICINGEDCWIVRTFYELRQRGLPVTISTQMDNAAINTAHIYSIGRKNRGLAAFLVICRADGHDTQLANAVIVQNEGSEADRLCISLPHWPQPGVIRRDAARGSKIEKLAFKGAPGNLDDAFRAPAFLDALRARGITFDQGSRDGASWRGYSDVALVVAVRNLTEYDAARKPASKLVNAWNAGVPALLGPEPAFRDIGTPDHSYIEVRSPDDVLSAIDGFRDDPKSYEAMIAVGDTLAAKHDNDHVAAAWIAALNGPLADAFERWQSMPKPMRVAQVARGFLREPSRKKLHRDRFSSGRRVLETDRAPHAAPYHHND